MAEARAVEPTVVLRPHRGWLWHVGRFAKTRPLGAVGGFSVLVVVLVAIFAPVIATHDPINQTASLRLTPPGSAFLVGSDQFGRDVFSRIVFGARISLYVGLLSVLLSLSIGTVIGVGSAYAGGIFDMLLQRVIDTMLGFPAVVLSLVLVVALGASLNNVTLAIALAYTPRMARLARSSAITVKTEDYILASRAIGASPLRIVARHLLPNSLTAVIVLATGYLGTAIVVEASLSFLGLGVPPPHPSWGRDIFSGAQNFLEIAPWLAISPGVALTFAVLGFNLFGDALRDTFDPRLRSG